MSLLSLFYDWGSAPPVVLPEPLFPPIRCTAPGVLTARAGVPLVITPGDRPSSPGQHHGPVSGFPAVGGGPRGPGKGNRAAGPTVRKR